MTDARSNEEAPAMKHDLPERFRTHYTPADQELATRQWAQWRATRRRLVQMGAFGGAGFALGLGAGRPPLITAAAPRTQDEQPKNGGSLSMSLADADVTSFDPPVPP